MIYFLYLLCSIAVVYAISYLFGKRQKQFFFVVTGVLLTLFLGFRDIETGGIDLLRYNKQYDMLLQADSISMAFEMREGSNFMFFIAMYVSAQLGLTFQLFLLIAAAFTVTASLRLYYRYSNYPLLCMCIFLATCYIHLFSQLKQTIAVAITIFAYIKLRQNRRSSAYALLILAATFHPTAIVMIPFFYLSQYPANQALLLILFLGSLLVFVLRMQIGYYLSLAFNETYVDSYVSRESITSMAVLFIVFVYIYLFMMPKRQSITQKDFLVISSYLYALIIAMTLFFCSSYSYAFTRLNNYFMVFVPLALSEIAEFGFWKRNFRSNVPALIIYGGIMYVMVRWFLDMIVSQRLDLYKFYWMT